MTTTYKTLPAAMHHTCQPIARRHLDKSQLGILAGHAKIEFEPENKAKELAGKSADGKAGGRGRKKNLVETLPQGLSKSRDQAAALFGVSHTLVDRGARVIRDGVPELRAALSRRHLLAGQKAMLGAELKGSFAAEAKKRMSEGGKAAGRSRPAKGREMLPDPIGKASDQAAAVAGVSGRTVADATTVAESGDPETVAAVKAGKVSVSKAAQNAAAEIKLRAERRAGELLKPNIKHGGDRKSSCHDGSLKLSDLGIGEQQSSRWQRIADLPADRFEALICDTLAAGRELTSIGAMLRIGEISRGLKKAKPPGKKISPTTGLISKNSALKEAGLTKQEANRCEHLAVRQNSPPAARPFTRRARPADRWRHCGRPEGWMPAESARKPALDSTPGRGTLAGIEVFFGPPSQNAGHAKSRSECVSENVTTPSPPLSACAASQGHCAQVL